MDDNRRFLQQTEQAIRITNNEVIHAKMPPITTERMLTFAVAVANLRTDYFEAAFKFADSVIADGGKEAVGVNELERCRKGFVEARDAFISLQRAIELGYVAVEME